MEGSDVMYGDEEAGWAGDARMEKREVGHDALE